MSSYTITSSLFQTFLSFFYTSNSFVISSLTIFKCWFSYLRTYISFLYCATTFYSASLLFRRLRSSNAGLLVFPFYFSIYFWLAATIEHLLSFNSLRGFILLLKAIILHYELQGNGLLCKSIVRRSNFLRKLRPLKQANFHVPRHA